MMGWKELIERTSEDKYDHFSFDFWSTMAYSNPKFKNGRCELIASLEDHRNSKEHIDKAFSKIGKEYNEAMEGSGIINNPEFLYRRVFKELGICESKVSFYQEKIEKLFLEYPPIFSSGFLQYYDHISQFKSTKSITSNTAFVSGEIILEALGQNLPNVCFDFSLFSDQIGCAKPSTEIYDIVKTRVSLLHIEKSQIRILHIGDNEHTDFNGAIKNGLDAFIINTL